jgi:hypothetical protein
MKRVCQFNLKCGHLFHCIRRPCVIFIVWSFDIAKGLCVGAIFVALLSVATNGRTAIVPDWAPGSSPKGVSIKWLPRCSLDSSEAYFAIDLAAEGSMNSYGNESASKTRERQKWTVKFIGSALTRELGQRIFTIEEGKARKLIDLGDARATEIIDDSSGKQRKVPFLELSFGLIAPRWGHFRIHRA